MFFFMCLFEFDFMRMVLKIFDNFLVDDDLRSLVERVFFREFFVFKMWFIKGMFYEIGYFFGLEYCFNDCVMNLL